MGRPIDVRFQGRERVICCYEVDGVLVDPGPASSVENLLAQLDSEPRALLLTHIHLDHAGATGVLVRRFPDLQVYVHERGAAHVVDPTKLLASASRLYGDQMERLWGEVAPVPERNVHALAGGERVEGFDVLYTRGHANHHVTYIDRAGGDAYVGDMAGVRIPPSDYTLAPTVPPEFDAEAWRESMQRIEAAGPASLNLTHFGRVDDVPGQFQRVRGWLERFAGEPAETEAEWFARLQEDIEGHSDSATAEAFAEAAPPHTLYPGIVRYWS
ncbi:MAG: MBL fold metallo-hydrolase [Thermoleophilaceae bacterium]|nr:MBL fold metallo-hydrolase [Thermoleophilaceae bacterium]